MYQISPYNWQSWHVNSGRQKNPTEKSMSSSLEPMNVLLYVAKRI